MASIIAPGLLALISATPAQAHYPWLEPGDDGVRLYFGEPDAGLRESSPGKLDTIKLPRVVVVESGGAKASGAPVIRKPMHLVVTDNKKAEAVLVAEESLEVRDLTKNGLGFAKTNYYTRYGKAGAEDALLALDVRALPETNHYVVSYRGQPLGKATLDLVAPNTWVQQYKTDAQGQVKINTPWRGQYIIHVLHVDKTPGEFTGVKYDILRNHHTYTFSQSQGADPGPAVPPLAPPKDAETVKSGSAPVPPAMPKE